MPFLRLPETKPFGRLIQSSVRGAAIEPQDALRFDAFCG
jgi:hypothetical protein